MQIQVADVVACVPNLERFARRLIGNDDAVADLVQETVTRALGHLHRYQPTSDLKAWLFTIMKNYVRDQWRKQRRFATVSLSDSDADQRPAAASQIDRLMLRELVEAIDRLPRRQRDVLMHVSIDTSSYESASAALGIPVGTVRSRLFRARNSLLRMLDEREAATGGAPRRRRLN